MKLCVSNRTPLITARMTGLEFGIGVFVGLAGILVCSMLGGMKAVTWTQVAQYIILIIAYLTPVIWLSVKHTGVPVPQLMYGQVLQKVTEREKVLTSDPKEIELRNILKGRADAAVAGLKDPDQSAVKLFPRQAAANPTIFYQGGEPRSSS